MPLSEHVVEPGSEGDKSLGIPGPAEPMPVDDALMDEPTVVNDDDDEDDVNG